MKFDKIKNFKIGGDLFCINPFHKTVVPKFSEKIIDSNFLKEWDWNEINE